MNRRQFMDELNRLLMDIPAGERREAIQYYNDYFDDAGEENEEKVIRELGSPAQVARTIREGMAGGTAEYKDSSTYTSVSRQNTNIWKTVCMILLFILLCPVILPVGFGLLAAVVGIIIGVFGLLIGIVVSGAAFLIAGAATIVYGVFTLLTLPALGFSIGGVGCLLFGIGILLSLFTVQCCMKAAPAVIRYIVQLVQFPFRKAGIIK